MDTQLKVVQLTEDEGGKDEEEEEPEEEVDQEAEEEEKEVDEEELVFQTRSFHWGGNLLEQCSFNLFSLL